MPGSLINLCDSERFFIVQYGDFVRLYSGELRNVHRLHDAVRVTAETSVEREERINDPFCEGALYPDECVWYFQCRLPVNGANCAALLATGFRWTKEAASVANEYRIAAKVVEQIRQAANQLHSERMDFLRKLCAEGAEVLRLKNELPPRHERACVLIDWQAEDTDAYTIPSADIVVSPQADAEKRKKLWRLWAPPGRTEELNDPNSATPTDHNAWLATVAIMSSASSIAAGTVLAGKLGAALGGALFAAIFCYFIVCDRFRPLKAILWGVAGGSAAVIGAGLGQEKHGIVSGAAGASALMIFLLALLDGFWEEVVWWFVRRWK